MLVFPDYDVKNRVPLEFAFDETTTALIDEYISNTPAAVDAGLQPRLAVRRGGSRAQGHQDPIGTDLAASLEGARPGDHATQFRHAAAYIMLKADPGNYELVRRVLGHRSITTTRNFYIGLETLEARACSARWSPTWRRLRHQPSSPERSAMAEKIRAFPPCDWPTAERKSGQACVAARRLRPGGAAARMKPSTRTSLVRAYGYLLEFCHRKGLFDQDAEAGAHVTPEIIDAFVRRAARPRRFGHTRKLYRQDPADCPNPCARTRPCLARGD